MSGGSIVQVLTDAVGALGRDMLQLSLAGIIAWAAIVGSAVVFAFWLHHRREERRARAALDEAARLELDSPPSLHPVIDPDLCIGSGSCLDACPEGKILGMVNGVATLVSPSHCIGHGRCAAECPVGAIKLVFGSAKRGVDLPEVDGNFEASRPGVHIVGELGGMGLIKNAIVQGLQVSGYLGASLDRKGQAAGAGDADLVIVGAGPAGIATAVGARAAGLSFVLAEQDSLGGTVAHYPRQKIVMSETVNLPYYGPFGRSRMSKEDLIVAFHEVIARAHVRVYEGTKVVGIDGLRDEFVVRTSRGPVRARRVVLAIGRRGSPRRLGVPGEELPKVAYGLIDPNQYDGKRVLVVGGGDSALEAAIMLAEQSSAEVGIVYRRPEFAKCRPPNKQKIDALIAGGRVRAFMSAEVGAVKPQTLDLRLDGVARAVPNDFVIACLGGELPTDFLKSVDVGLRRHHGDRPMPNPALAARAPSRSRRRTDSGWVSAAGLALLGCGIVVALAAIGFHYYRLPQALRYASPDHARLKPSGAWGHGIGILATAFMLLNFAYSVRKRWKRFKGKGSIAPWLRFHVFVGTMSPLTILFHSAFQWGNHLATATYVSLVVLVVTGLIGRYFYGLIRFDRDNAIEAAALRQYLKQALDDLPVRLPRLSRLVANDKGAASEAAGSPAPDARSLLLAMPADNLLLRREIASARQLFVHRATWATFRRQALRLRRLEVRRHADRRFKRLMSRWRVVHVTLAILLIGLIGLHVTISIRFGFKWIWS